MFDALSRLLSPGQRQPKCKKELGKTRETRWKVSAHTYTHTKPNKRAVDNLFMSVYIRLILFLCSNVFYNAAVNDSIIPDNNGHQSHSTHVEPLPGQPVHGILCAVSFSLLDRKKKKKFRPSYFLTFARRSWSKKERKKNSFYIIKARPIVPTPSFTDVPTRRHLWQSVPHINLLISRFLPNFPAYLFSLFLLCVQVGSVRLLDWTGDGPVYGIGRQTGAAQQQHKFQNVFLIWIN